MLTTINDSGVRYVYLTSAFVYLILGMGMTPWDEVWKNIQKQEPKDDDTEEKPSEIDK